VHKVEDSRRRLSLREENGGCARVHSIGPAA
jgi:hypothetical protein